MAHTTHIAPLDLAPTGHLPAIVAQAALTPAQADGLACIHCGREDGPMVPAGTVNGTQVFRCSPACPTDDEPAHTRPAHVAEILGRVEAHLPHVDPELAARGRRALTFARASRLLTRQQMELTYDEDFGGHRTARIETEARDIDDQHTAEENASVPLLAAEAVVTDWKPAEPVLVDGRWQSGGSIDGRFTQLWVSYGTSTGTVTPAKARELAGEMRAFAARLEALCDVADELAADDYEARG